MPKSVKTIFKQLFCLAMAAVVAWGVFLILPVLQVMTRPLPKDLIIRTAEVVGMPPPPMEHPKSPPPEEEPPPLPEVDSRPLDLSQLELALDPRSAFGGGDFAINLSEMAAGSEQVDAIFSLSDLDRKPRVVYQPVPLYPPEMARKGLQGTVYILFIVDRNGRTRDLKVQQSSHPSFNNPALKAVEQWKFEPGQRRGKPVRFRMRVPITFKQ